MKAKQTTQLVLPTGWTATLEKVQVDLQEALAGVLERENALGEIPNEERPSSVLGNFAQGAERLQGLTRCGKQAEQIAAQVDLELQGGEDGLQSWLEAARNLRQKLADWQTK